MAGRWRRVAAGLMIVGGFADAALARPRAPAPLDGLLFAVGLLSLLAFLAFGTITWPRLSAALAVASASVYGASLAIARGASPTEVAIATIDITLRILLGLTLLVLWARHLRFAAPRRRRRRHHRAFPP